ncbi:hypothetical protein B1992_01415 [Pseudoxanthomonas broegbernensis]|uniref:DUF3325 domain-containing protein n=1 Tax=Pseudoxanthomonas broegbernensis TaxID=83619 RepID=A0A7V8GQ95_9GAMM|nr:DUF3325 domain-containing protein [Pseudoxanthomonas broegbernensis]KAF1688109.1 hypothetical protein B1992_01415 [Pseudoxanthomonas broegbernensis]MBB6065150.1 hypothetical protein [Pseudoxanthomonas broegbernensis]
MPEPAHAAWLLGAALAASVAGMGWLALAMRVHAQQVWGTAVPPSTAKALRILGVLGLLAALALCLAADHASMAVLVWVMTLAGAAFTVAFTLAWRARWLGVLAPWVRACGARR